MVRKIGTGFSAASNANKLKRCLLKNDRKAEVCFLFHSKMHIEPEGFQVESLQIPLCFFCWAKFLDFEFHAIVDCFQSQGSNLKVILMISPIRSLS